MRAMDDYAPVPLPAALRELPAFEPTGMDANVLADLRRRAAAARDFVETVNAWAVSAREFTEKVVEQTSINTVLRTDLAAITFAALEVKAEQSFNDMIARHQDWRKIVSELMTGTSRAAWLGYLDPFIEALSIQASEPRKLRRVLHYATNAILPGYFGFDFDKVTASMFLDQRAAEYLRNMMHDFTGMPCSHNFEIVLDAVAPVVSVHVPHGVDRPHRLLSYAEEEAFRQLERMAPDLLGRAAIKYVKMNDAA